ncbi:probable Na(+)/H(+) antiporter nhx-9 [Agrilus planipennis]|uniref:Sodium/hydrogen exchanger n=1 Tax=Agrilus planipennis TaxID=224129 RepID=A0A7F5RL98_AGRPL|nr:probable Na(+)/H(+) antiporter nhx-9 [Agrilus planipennis]
MHSTPDYGTVFGVGLVVLASAFFVLGLPQNYGDAAGLHHPRAAAPSSFREDVPSPSFNGKVISSQNNVDSDFPPIVFPADDADGHDHKSYEISSVDFHRVETPFIIGIWIFSASLAKIGFHMTPKLSAIFPESCLLIVVGVVIGVVLVYATESAVALLTPNLFFFYMLPPIILDAGYFMPNRLFFDHLGTILLFAVVGTIFNCLTIGVSLWAVGLTGLFSVQLPILDSLLFAALISAVDPVAVLAVFEEIHVNEILYIIVFGESLLNDAVTVVLYHMFEAYTEMGAEKIVYQDVLSGFASFIVVAVGGTLIGIVWGFATGFVTRFTYQVRVIEPIFIFVMAYLAYLSAEIFHMSGILAITFCGITMKNYVEANISHKSHTTIKYAMKMLSSSSETIIFMFLGIATVNKNHDWNTYFIVLTIMFCSFYRALGVILFSALANRFRVHQLQKVDKFVMSYGGLRGAVAFALVSTVETKVVKLQPMFMTTTIAVIYFTVFFQGITIKPLVKVLKVKTAEKRKPTMNERIHEKVMDHLMAGIEDILGLHGNFHVRDRFKHFDNKFIRPYLVRNYTGAEPKILETYSKLAMRDAIEFMRRNASTIGNMSGTESMSAIFRNYTAGTLNGSTSFSQLDNSTWNIDMQELEYNPSRKDLTDAKIHHLLAEELCKPKRMWKITDDSILIDPGKRESRGSIDGVDLGRVATPTATERMLPWKRNDENEFSAPVQQSEFPAWASNKEYLAYNSPSATFLGGIENPRSSVIGLFRKDSTNSGQASSPEVSPQKERRRSSGANAVLLIEENELPVDPLGAIVRPRTSQGSHTPTQKKPVRRGSMLELTGILSREAIPEEVLSNRWRRSSCLPTRTTRTPRTSERHNSISSTALLSSPSPTPTDESSVDEDDDDDLDDLDLMKAGF